MIKVITTDDGSSSLYVEELDETYHSQRGAIAESEHIYINAGLRYLLQQGVKEIELFEMGFGTGLNAILTYKEIIKHEGVRINYTSLDNFPLSADVCRQLVYDGITNDVEIAPVFGNMHKAAWAQPASISARFVLKKVEADINTYRFDEGKINCVYYDAFAPSKQAEVWKPEIFEKLWQAMQTGGVLVTYCASGFFKRTLKQVGFEVVALPGPAGKKQITRAIKQ